MADDTTLGALDPQKDDGMLSMERSTTPTVSEWIAIEPPLSPNSLRIQGATRRNFSAHYDSQPPSFEAAQFDMVLRRQRQRPKDGGGVKLNTLPSRFLNLSNDFEFAGWGTVSRFELNPDDLCEGGATLQNTRRMQTLGQFTASALAGNAVLGSVFYALPAVVVVSSVYSPISLFIATLVLFLWRPIMEELASALPVSGAPYTYILNVSSKSLAIFSAALLLLDYAATSVVSAATAITYLTKEVTFPFPEYVGTIIIIVLFMMISLTGLKESARIALAVLALHAITMVALMTASIVAWGRFGNGQIKENWTAGRPATATASDIARQVFNGVCIGMLGLTGFECTPSYVASIKPGRFPLVLRNLHYPAIVLNAMSMLLVLTLVPLEQVLAGANVLSVLAEVAAGRWLRIWVVVDAVIVLCGGVLTGILGACELLDRLAHDRVLPHIFLSELPLTRARHIAVLAFGGFSGVLYAISGASLSIVSKMFSMVWLVVMTLFPLSSLLLKFNRGRLDRQPHTPLSIVFLTFVVAAVVMAGNIVIDPSTVGYAAAYVVGLVALFSVTQKKGRIVHWVYWAYDQTPFIHKARFFRRWDDVLVRTLRATRRQPVCVLVRTDEINHLFQQVLYVSRNEETACLKLVHFCDDDTGIPSEMEANWKILDEAFPEITIDLILVRAPFNPENVAALAHRLQIPPSLMFISCPGKNFPHLIADLGTRIISL